MSEARTFLLAALQRIADGGDLRNEELEAAIPDPVQLDSIEKPAWEELSHWADDDDIRAKDKRYGEAKRNRIRNQIAALTS